MTISEKGLKSRQIAGRISAVKSRQRAIQRYYDNPTLCLYCHNIIPVKDGERVADIRNKKFCGSSCSASYSNPRRERQPLKTIQCTICRKLFTPKKGSQQRRKRCDACCIHPRINIYYESQALPNIGHLTKGQLFSKCKSWQGARSQIVKHARVSYFLSNKPRTCLACGYTKYFQVAHMRSVSSFEDNILISVINDPNNLIALCPTHHWEFDHNCLDEPLNIRGSL